MQILPASLHTMKYGGKERGK